MAAMSASVDSEKLTERERCKQCWQVLFVLRVSTINQCDVPLVTALGEAVIAGGRS
jgi:hypothetical protein